MGLSNLDDIAKSLQGGKCKAMDVSHFRASALSSVPA